MSATGTAATPRAGFPAVLLPLLLLFAATGCAALIYEIVWYQLLELALGSTALSLGVLLATFMGGLCLGSLAFPRLLPHLPRALQHPFRIYAAIEIAIGVFGILELWAIPLVGELYVAGAQSGLPGLALRAAAASMCLLPPTILMGASLPALVRWFDASRAGVAHWGMLYGANTAGAVFGCLFASFYLLRLYDVTVASITAAAINVAAALVAALLALRFAARFSGNATAAVSLRASAQAQPERISVFVAIALSGATALGAQVVWTRLLGLLFGGTVYAFSLILAVFLVGLVIGTALASALVRRVDARLALGWCQFFAAGGIAWSGWMIAEALPYWPINPLLSASAGITFQMDLVRAVLAILPAPLFWGASFPFAFAAAARTGEDPARTVAIVYAANTFGAILGALAVSLALIPLIGTQQTQRVLLLFAATSALAVLVPWIRSRERAERDDMTAFAGAAAIACCILAYGIAAVPGELIAYGRRIAITAGHSEILHTAEGRSSSIAISRWDDGSIQFHVSGKVEASTMPSDMKLERMLGHLGALIHPDPKSVLVVGFGAGVTAGSFVPYGSVQRITICELEPLIPPTSTAWFKAQNYDVMNNPRTRMVYDDARHFVLTDRGRYDLITSDPIHPFVKGSAALYSLEYFEHLKAHLAPGGMVTQWLPLYESDEASVKSQMATFFAVFPHATVWANTVDGKGYDVVLIGHLEKPVIDLDAVEARLARPDYASVVASLRDVGIRSAVDLFSTYIGERAGLERWLADAEINRDRNLRLQYLAGLALNQHREDAIYRAIREHRGSPRELFRGSEPRLNALLARIATGDAGDE